MIRNTERYNTLNTIRILFAFVAITISASSWAVPGSINYQGYLTDSSGGPINTTVDVTFRIYNVETGGTELWSETDSVAISEGKFTSALGDGTSFPLNLFDGAVLYLGIEVETDGEMSPRKALQTAPFAFKAGDADTLQGMSSAEFISALGEISAPDGIDLGGGGSIQGVDNITFDNTQGGALTFQDGSSQSTNAVNSVLSSDGAGSTLDADLLDGQDSTAFLNRSGDSMLGDLTMQTGEIMAPGGVDFQNEGNITNVVDLAFGSGLGGAIQFEDGSFQDTNAVNSILAADGDGSGLDADLLDGLNANEIAASAGDSWRVVVAPSGGDYTSINAAIAAISPTASNPFVVEVRPGTYNENVKLKSYVHLKGSGKETTKIFPLAPGGAGSSDADFAAIAMVSLTAVKVTGFTLAGGDFEGDPNGIAGFGIYDVGSSPMVADNRIQFVDGSGVGSLTRLGMFSNNSTPQVYRNEFIENSNAGLYLLNAYATVTENTFDTNGGGTPDCGVAVVNSEAVISNNLFANNAHGVCTLIDGGTSTTATITSNHFADNFDAVRIFDGEAEIVGNRILDADLDGNFGVYTDAGTDTVVSGNIISGYMFGISNSGRSKITGNEVKAGHSGGTAISNFGTANILGNSIIDNAAGITDTTGAAQIIGNRLENISNRGINADTSAQVFANFVQPGATNPSSDNKVATTEGFTFQSTNGSVVLSAGGSSISIAPDGNITISSTNNVSLTSVGTMSFNSGSSMNFTAGTSLTLAAGSDINIDSSNTVDIDAGQNVTLDAGNDFNATVDDVRLTAADDIFLNAPSEIDLTTGFADVNASTEADLTSPLVDLNGSSEVEITAPIVDINGSSQIDADAPLINLN